MTNKKSKKLIKFSTAVHNKNEPTNAVAYK